MLKKYFSLAGLTFVVIYFALILMYIKRQPMYIAELAACQAQGGFLCGYNPVGGLLYNLPLIISVPIMLLIGYLTGWLTEKLTSKVSDSRIVAYFLAIILTFLINIPLYIFLWPELLRMN